MNLYRRQHFSTLRQRLDEPVRFIQIVAGPRQVGKTTMVRQLLEDLRLSQLQDVAPLSEDLDFGLLSADDPVDRTNAEFDQDRHSQRAILTTQADEHWLVDIWKQARAKATSRRSLHPKASYVLAIDEIQKIPQWSSIVKGLWDQDRANKVPLHVVLLGSAPLLIQQGLTESLAGRFELVKMGHWSFSEMQAAFGWTLDQFIYFGGYPGAAPHSNDEPRWRDYVRDSLIQPSITRDVLQMTRVDKPALLRQLFELGAIYSGQIVSLDKLRGMLTDAGNVTTLKQYLNLLESAGLLSGLGKYSFDELRKRAAPPKLNVQNTALTSALSTYTFDSARADRAFWGRLVESAIGAHLINQADPSVAVMYWRDGPNEIDFVITTGNSVVALEVKSGERRMSSQSFDVFQERLSKRVKKFKRIYVGSGPQADVSVTQLLSVPLVDLLSRWI
jgi:uncharacterized protein